MSTRTARIHARLRTAARTQHSADLGPKALRMILREALFDGADVPQWRESAACTDPEVDADVFYPAAGWADEAATAAAKAVCAACPVRCACLADALSWETPRTRYGVLGGLTPTERADLAAAVGVPEPVGVAA